jgi:hypothetical protein
MRLISHALFSGQFLIALMDTSVGGWVGGCWVFGWVGGGASCETMIIIIFSFSRILLKMEIHSH